MVKILREKLIDGIGNRPSLDLTEKENAHTVYIIYNIYYTCTYVKI